MSSCGPTRSASSSAERRLTELRTLLALRPRRARRLVTSRARLGRLAVDDDRGIGEGLHPGARAGPADAATTTSTLSLRAFADEQRLHRRGDGVRQRSPTATAAGPRGHAAQDEATRGQHRQRTHGVHQLAPSSVFPSVEALVVEGVGRPRRAPRLAQRRDRVVAQQRLLTRHQVGRAHARPPRARRVSSSRFIGGKRLRELDGHGVTRLLQRVDDAPRQDVGDVAHRLLAVLARRPRCRRWRDTARSRSSELRVDAGSRTRRAVRLLHVEVEGRA